MESIYFLQPGEVKTALLIHSKDNVAVVLADIAEGEDCLIRDNQGTEQLLKAAADIEFGHKIALCDIGAGADVFKYGEAIGSMTEAVAKGGWIHNHNMGCGKGM